MENNNRRLTFIDENGNQRECEILFTVESKEFNKKYVLFYEVDSVNGSNENIEIQAASYEDNDEAGGQLYPVETEEEWAYLEEMLSSFENECK